MIYDIGHIRFTLTEAGEGATTFALTAPHGENPKKKLFTGFADASMPDQLRALADVIEKEISTSEVTV